MRWVFVAAACLFVSCTSTRERLIGDWQNTTGVRSGHYSFRADGSFAGDVAERGKLVSKFTGRWELERKTLHYEYEHDALGAIPQGTRDRDKLIEINADHYVIQAADGTMRRYDRIR